MLLIIIRDDVVWVFLVDFQQIVSVVDGNQKYRNESHMCIHYTILLNVIFWINKQTVLINQNMLQYNFLILSYCP